MSHGEEHPWKWRAKVFVKIFGRDANGRRMIAWGRRIGCRDAGHGFEPGGRGVYTRLLVDDGDPRQHSSLMASREDWKSQFATSKLERYAKMDGRTSWRRFEFPSVPALARAIRL